MASDNAHLLNQLKIDRNAPSSKDPRSRKKLWIIIGSIVGLLIASMLALMIFGQKEIPVETTTVASASQGGSTASAVLDASGYIVARRIATVSSKVTGRVSRVLIEEGQTVTAGQVMATLDPVDAAQQRDLAAAQVAASDSQAGSLIAQLKEANAAVARLSVLAKQQLVARAQLDQAIAQRDALSAQLATARKSTQVASSQLRIATQGVDNTVVRAPFAGVVIAKAAQPGEIVSPLSAGGGFTRTGIGTIVDMDSLEVEVDVGESYIGRVKQDMLTETILNAYPEWKIPGRVIAVIPTADRGKATIKVRVSLDQKDIRVVPDMGARVSFLEPAQPRPANQPPPVMVPSGAVAERDGKKVVFIVADEKASQRIVTTGREISGDLEVVSGLKAGDVIVTNPTDAVSEGARVKVQVKEPEEG